MAAETMGIDTTFFKVMAFALSAAYAGFGGSLFAHSGSHYISPDTFSFDQSVVLLAMAVLGGNGSRDRGDRRRDPAHPGAGGAAVPQRLLHDGLRRGHHRDHDLHAGRHRRPGVRAPAQQAASRVVGFGSAVAADVAASTRPGGPPPAPVKGGATAVAGEIVLTVKGLAKHFGGLKAVDGVDMNVRTGEIQALIGPNGSGKTTILNMLSGLYVPTDGEIVFEGVNVTGKRPHAITAVGMARTFQNIRLFGELTVLDNVMIGQHSRSSAGLVSSVVQPPSQQAEEAAMRRKALEMLAFVGLRGKEFAMAKSLPYGQQRLLEIARALASDPKLLLLDEPAAGLNANETETLVELLFQIRDRGITILLVEHDMSLVMNVSDHITVLNFGKKIAEGNAEAIQIQPGSDRRLPGDGGRQCLR